MPPGAGQVADDVTHWHLLMRGSCDLQGDVKTRRQHSNFVLPQSLLRLTQALHCLLGARQQPVGHFLADPENWRFVANRTSTAPHLVRRIAAGHHLSSLQPGIVVGDDKHALLWLFSHEVTQVFFRE